MFSEFIRLSRIAYRHPEKIVKAVTTLLFQGPRVVRQKLVRQDILADYNAYLNMQYLKWFKKNYPSRFQLNQEYSQSLKFKIKPKISIITPTYNTPEKFLRECIESVLNQSYQNFELCIADDASTDPKVKYIIREYSAKDKRIKFVFRPENGHISQASNSAIKISTGSFIAILDHDDVLWPNALFEVVKALNKNPDAEFFYSDEDKLDEDGRTHIEPFFKPDFSPDYLNSINYITHFAVIKKSLVNRVGGFQKIFDGAQDWDLFLRISQLTNNTKIIHIPTILYSWRKSLLSASSEKSTVNVKKYAFQVQKKVLENNLKSIKCSAKVLSTRYLGLWRVKYKISGNPLVSIIIPTKNNFECINRCLNSIFKKTTYKNYQLVIVDTGSTEKEVWNLYDLVKSNHPQTKIIKWDKEFNFASVSNFGAEYSDGEYLLFLNNDTVVITHDWIESMLEHAQRKNIGAVGVKLLFPNQRIQHIGIILGIAGGLVRRGIAGHPLKNFYDQKINAGYSRIADSIKNCSAVTAACMMISKEKFFKIGGFNPIFRIAFNDVDFCLRLRMKKLDNLYTPYAVLYHYESVSVGKPGEGGRKKSEFLHEVKLMHQKWDKILTRDPYYNPNYTLKNEEYTLKI